MDSAKTYIYNKMQTEESDILALGSRMTRLTPIERKVVTSLCQQYYLYLTLLKITSNFQKNPELYRHIDMNKYHSKLTIIGAVQSIDLTERDSKGLVYPIITTPINSYLFGGQGVIGTGLGMGDRSLNTTFKAIKRRLVFKKEDYFKPQVIQAFNKMIGLFRKDKDQLFAFTHLKVFISSEEGLFFGLTAETEVIQIQKYIYNSLLKHMQNSLSSNFSELNLSFMKSVSKGGTFTLAEVEERINELQKLSIMGVLKTVDMGSLKVMNPREKEITIELMQESYRQVYDRVGVCKLYIRFDQTDEGELLNKLVVGGVYLVVVDQIVINENLKIIYRVNQRKISIIRILLDSVALPDLEERFRNMKCSKLTMMTRPGIWRNYYRFRVIKVEIKMLWFKTHCDQCQGWLVRTKQDEYHCRRDCGGRDDMTAWAVVGCMDSKMYGQFEFDKQKLLSFFNLQSQYPKLFEQIHREQVQNSKQGISVVRNMKNNNSHNNQQEYDNSKIYLKNDYLIWIANMCQIKIIEKELVAFPKFRKNDNINHLREEDREEMVGSFVKQKDHIKRMPLFLNGQFSAGEDRGRLIPQLEVQAVYDCPDLA